MKLFLDTANLKEIETIHSWGVLDGVTTNPTLVAKEGVDFEKRVRDICKIVSGPVSAEVISTDTKGMLVEGRKYAKWAKNVVVKVPMTADGLRAVKQFSEEGIQTNVTLCFSANQALLAAKAGATMISPFVGRLDDLGQDGLEVIREITDIYFEYGFATEVLFASVRHPRHVTDAARLGVDICTLPFGVFQKLVAHPMTDLGLAKFLEDWKKVSGKEKGVRS